MMITSIKKQKKDSNRYNIFIDHNYSFSADYEDILELGIKEGMILEQEALENLILNCQYKKALNKAIRYLTSRWRSEKEVRVRLKTQNFDETIIEKVIRKLKYLKYIDDRQFTNVWIHDRKNLKPMGRRRLVEELKNKGVDPELINDSLAESGQDDLATAITIAKKKIGIDNCIAKGSKDYEKIYRHLLYRGIDYDTAHKALDTIADETYKDSM